MYNLLNYTYKKNSILQVYYLKKRMRLYIFHLHDKYFNIFCLFKMFK